MNRVGFIGVGELALYCIKGFRRGGYADQIMLSPRNPLKAELLARDHGCVIQPDNQAVVENSDYVVISTRPADCLKTLSALKLGPEKILLSVVAGISIESLREIVGEDIHIIRAMPVSSAQAGSSPTLIYPADPFVKTLFDHCGKTISVDNEAFFEQGSVLACVYSWFFALFEELIKATQGPALPPELAAQLVMGMARGAADLALQRPDEAPGEIARAIATEGTYSKLGLDLLHQHQAFEPWRLASELLKRKLAGAE